MCNPFNQLNLEPVRVLGSNYFKLNADKNKCATITDLDVRRIKWFETIEINSLNAQELIDNK